MSPVTSPARASLPTPKKTSTLAKDNPLPKQDTSAPDVHMDTGAQQDIPDTGADTSGTGTTDNAGASSKSVDIDKGKAPEVPELQAEPEQATPGQAMNSTLDFSSREDCSCLCQDQHPYHYSSTCTCQGRLDI
jgi:hypothetical protein